MNDLVIAGVVLFAVVATGCDRREKAPAESAPAAHAPHAVARSGLAMGSSLTLMAWTADEDTANRAFDAVFAEFDRLDRLMSVWKADSDIVRLNAAAGDHPVPVSADTMAAMLAAQQASEWSTTKLRHTPQLRHSPKPWGCRQKLKSWNKLSAKKSPLTKS